MSNLYKPFLKLFTFYLIFIGTIQSSYGSGLMTAKGSPTKLQLKDHSVTVTIEDGYAITQVDNSFFNPSNQELEAVYEFPVPKNGTVASFSIWIDDQEVIGEVVEKQRAKKLYQQEKAAGRDAGLTEKVKHYRFESRVSPIRAQQITRTRIVYMQPADVEGGIGRYVYPLEEGGTDQSKLDFWQTDDKVHGKFSFDMNLRSGYPVDAVRAPSHPHAVISGNNQQWNLSINRNGKLSLASEEQTVDQDQRTAAFADLSEPAENSSSNSINNLNQDIVVYWRLQPNLPGSIDLVTHREPGQRRGTFMLSVTPGVDLQPITEGRDWVFVLDRSGSMSGKYQTLMDATSQALSKLSSQDRFRIILFSSYVEELTNGWVQANEISVQQISEKLRQSDVDGGTDIYSGLQKAIKGMDSDRTSSIVLITDGEANIGKTHKKDFIDLLSKQDVRLFTGIMGNGANRPLLESMTRVSNGFATNISNSDDVLGVLLQATEKVAYEAMHDVDLKIKGLRTSDLVPAQPTTLYRGQQLVLFGHYYGDDEAEVILTTKISGEQKQYRSRFNFPKQSTNNPEVERLWAFAKIQELKDKASYLGTSTADYRSAIVDTAIEYGLVTDFTSMLVMTDQQFEQNGIERRNKKRRQKEIAAAKQRASQAVKTNRVDTQQPAFNGGSRPSYSGGGGAINPVGLLILIMLGVQFHRSRKQH